MKLIALYSFQDVEAGETFEVDGSEACRLVLYGLAAPVHPGPPDAPRVGQHKRRPSDAAVAAALRAKERLKAQNELSRRASRQTRSGGDPR